MYMYGNVCHQDTTNTNILGPQQTREIAVDSYVYSTTKMSQPLLVFDTAFPHTYRGVKTVNN